MYCRFESGVHPREPQTDLLLATANHTHSLDNHIKYLSKRISSMKSFIAKAVENKFNKVNENHSRTPTDNRYYYEKTRELEASDHDHPLKEPTESKEEAPSIDAENLTKDLESVALDWKSLRNTHECICSSYFDQMSKKTHCRRCGNIFCMRCITKKTILPGHLDQSNVSVCKPCYEILVSSTETSE